MVNSEGSSLQYGNHYLAFRMEISGMADDGMNLERDEMYCAASFGNMPDEAKITADAERIVKELEALLTAPVVQPYSGPAILRNRASGVFFHEIFGHRIEGHRQKSSQEGQTFTKKVNEQILPQYISIYDDPTLEQLNGEDLRGYYRFDDEGVPAQRVTVVEKGVLKNFLMSRSPIENFSVSNGHGRRDHGNDIVSRQGNMIIHSEKTVPFDALRRELIEECKRQNKPYGLIFDDISGGFTMMQRWAPQAFKVKPLLVHRVYTDGRPDEVVRGVDIVGTPLTSFSKILMTADDTGVFNGSCGAESGMVPVSGISPSILVSEIEVEKRQKGQEKAPILPPPLHDQGKAKIGE
jgi:predicted Zn-dependent protease